MPDILIKDIDARLAERIRQLAAQRQWSVEEVVLHALRHGLGLASSGAALAETRRNAGAMVLEGQWDAREQAAFQEAIQALAVSEPAATGSKPCG